MSGRRLSLSCAVLVVAALVAVAANDPYGDPIPGGAKARLGTARMRTFYGAPNVLTPDGKYLVGQAPGGGVIFYEPATGKAAKTVKVEGGFSMPAGFSADGKRAVNSAYDNTFVWETESGKVLAKVKRPSLGSDNGLSLSATGKRLAVGGVRREKEESPTAQVWDVDGNKPLITVKPVQNETVYVALSPDGKRLATWGYHFERNAKEPPKPEADPARQVQFWDATSGKETGKAYVPGGYNPTMVVFSADGTLAATSGGNGAVYLFDPSTGSSKGLLLGRSRQGRKLAFSPDGKTLASGGDDGSIQRWSLPDGKRLGTTEPPVPIGYAMRAILFTGNDRIVAWGVRGIVGVVWEVPSGKLLTPAGGHTAGIQSAAIAGGGKEILTAGQDGQILRWEPGTGKELGSITLKVPSLAPGASSFTPPATLATNATRALAPDGSGGLALYDLPAGTQQFVIPGDPTRENRGSFSTDGTKVVQVMSAFDTKKNPTRVAVWDVGTAKRLGQVELPGIGLALAVLTPDSKTLVTAGVVQDEKGNGPFTVTAWELASGKKFGEYTEAGGFATGFIAATGDNKSVVAVTPKGTALVIDVMSGKRLRDLDVGRAVQAAAAPAVSPDGKTIAILTGGGFGPDTGGSIILIDLDSGKQKKTLSGISGTPSTAVFSPDGKLLVTGSQDTTALVWEVAK